LCPVVPVFDELVSTGILLIQALTERHYPFFSIVIPVVVGSSPISHPIDFQEDFVLFVVGDPDADSP
jgi:hypothetical protein